MANLAGRYKALCCLSAKVEQATTELMGKKILKKKGREIRKEMRKERRAARKLKRQQKRAQKEALKAQKEQDQ